MNSKERERIIVKRMGYGYLKFLIDVLHFSMAMTWIVTLNFLTGFNPIAVTISFFLICTNIGHWAVHFLYVAEQDKTQADWKALLKGEIKDEVCEELKEELYPNKLIKVMKDSINSQR